MPLGPGQPGAFLHALGERDDWEELLVFGALLVDLYAVLTKPGVKFFSGFFGPAERFLRDSGADIEFVPADFRRFEPVLQQLSPRVMITSAALPDDDGYVSLSLHAGASVAELHRAAADPGRMVIAEVSPHFPRTFGFGTHDHRLHLDEIDVLVLSDRQPFLLQDVPGSDVERSIAQYVARFITDGCTLQTGIGGVPSLVARMLAEGPGGDYGVHSEMLTTGLMHLHKAGKISNRKGVFDGVSVTTFAAGTEELYTWLDHNRDVAFLPVNVVNSPEIIAKNRKMVTINGALAVDLHGQAIADSIDGRQFSGIGGHEDFIAVSGLELEDRSLLCVPSTATVAGHRISRIVPAFPAGAVITTPRHQLDVVITEYGAAKLRGRTVRERAFALAQIAHPDFRDELRDRADALPRS
ncbi:MAG: acetyl-CoA hydrolase/transferase C-terminal domain-containing protein [Acidimicrobiia bacterium]